MFNINIFEIEFENLKFVIKIDIIAALVFIAIIATVSFILKKTNRYLYNSSIDIDEVCLGIGKNNHVKLKYNHKDKEIAYKLWVEISTRKIGLPFDEENDVIVEVYNSWYEFFKIARELMKEIPYRNNQKFIQLTELTERVLNDGIRPHLTTWQARFRKWYKNASENDGRDPQDIQRDFPEYETLIKDIKETNKKMVAYKNYLLQIAKGE